MISEVSLALVLLMGSSLLIRTFIALHGVNPGFDAHNVLTMEMSLTGARFEKTAGVAQLARDGRKRLNAIPGVEDSASPAACRFRGSSGCPSRLWGGRSIRRRKASRARGWMSASPDYYKTVQDSGGARARIQ